MTELRPGLVGHAEWTVDDTMTADKCGSGLLPVFSTPMLVALMEAAACDAIADCMPDGCTSVGSRIDAAHLAASPVGARVRAAAVLTGTDGKRLTFEIDAFEGEKKIGHAGHDRAIVDSGRFMARLK